MTGNCKAVCHAADEITDCTQLQDPFPALPPFGEERGIVAIGCGKIGDDAFSLQAHGLQFGKAVEPRIKKVLQLAFGRLELLRKARQLPSSGANVRDGQNISESIRRRVSASTSATM